MEVRIQKWFENLVSDYFQEEIKVVQKYLQVRSQVVMMTQYLSYVQDYISDFALNVSQSLAGERLFDLLKICAQKGPIDFAKTLLHQAQADAQGKDVALFYRILVRINEVDELTKELFPKFGERCLDVQQEQFQSRSRNFFN